MLKGIRLNMSIVPAIFVLLGVFALLFYPLTTNKMEEITSELMKSRGNKEGV